MTMLQEFEELVRAMDTKDLCEPQQARGVERCVELYLELSSYIACGEHSKEWIMIIPQEAMKRLE